MRLLILGNLDVNNDQLKVLDRLVDRYEFVQEDTNDNRIRQKLEEADIVFDCNFNLNKYIENLSKVKLVVMAETGIVNIDMNKAREKQINVSNLKTYSKEAVAEYILYCLLDSVRPWKMLFNKNFDRRLLYNLKSYELSSMKIGIIGFGVIGEYISKVLKSINSNISATYSNSFNDDGINYKKVEDIFRESDKIIISCSLNTSSKGLINKKLFSLLKDNATIISISSRNVINVNDLYNLLRRRKDVEAYMDFDLYDNDKMICNLDNAHISNHIAFYTKETLLNRTNQCIDILKDFLNNKSK